MKSRRWLTQRFDPTLPNSKCSRRGSAPSSICSPLAWPRSRGTGERKDNIEQWRKSERWSPRGRSTWGRSSLGGPGSTIFWPTRSWTNWTWLPWLDLPHVDLPLGLQSALFRHCSELSFLSSIPHDRRHAAGEQLDDRGEPSHDCFELYGVELSSFAIHRLHITILRQALSPNRPT